MANTVAVNTGESGGAPRVAKRSTWSVAIMVSPAAILLITFLGVPFLLAMTLGFTSQRLLSPNPTEFVGLRHFDRLLSVSYLTLEPERDEAGEIVRDEDGQIEYPRLRTITRRDPELRDYREMGTFQMGEDRLVIIAKDPVFWESLYNTFFFAFTVVPLQCGAALLMALLINRALKGRNFFRTVYFAPSVTSMVVVSVVWSFLYNEHDGLVNHYLHTFTFGAFEPVDWLGQENTAMPAITIMSAWQGAGFQMLIFLAGLQGISKDLYEAARMDGASAWQQFWNVTLPGLRNTTIFVVIATTIMAFSLFSQVDVMTGGGPHDSTSTVMFHAVRKGFRQQDIAYGSAITLVYFAIILAISLVQKRVFERGD